jgi:hypothetical protein
MGSGSAAVEELKARLESVSAEERRRLEELMDRYAVWLAGLPGERQRLIQEAPLERRIGLVETAREAERRRREVMGLLRDVLQVSALCAESIRRTAVDLRLWFALEPSRREWVQAAGTEAEQLRRFRVVVRSDPRLQRLRAEAAAELGPEGLEAREREPLVARRLERARPAARAELTRRMADWRLIRELGAREVGPERLEAFELALPVWVRSGLDPLPPEVARRRMELLYWLVGDPTGAAS